MKKSHHDFTEAINIYKLLLGKGFPQKAILKLVGDRYKLTGLERTILYRGICTRDNSKHRRSKLAKVKDIKNSNIYVDGYNVFITIGSYLNGNRVFVGNDNFLRDAAEAHGKVIRTELLDKAINLTLDYLKKIRVENVFIYLDKPVSKSGQLSDKINVALKNYNIRGEAITVDSPDHILKNKTDGIIATSDSNIIDNSRVAVFDLARRTISFHFKPEYLSFYKG